ncbi:MAG TPA: hypothetical protein VFB78_12100 [Acidimicrobiales bacterium]|jgi:hypothetical protein|nr:hypothetical protein [Acidimicrobiales bacterium]
MRSPSRYSGIVFVILATLATALFVKDVGADTNATPDTSTKAAVKPATPNVDPPGPFNDVAGGTTLSIHVHHDTVNRLNSVQARLCKPDLDVVTPSQLSPTKFGNCIGHPFVEGTDDATTNALSDADKQNVDLEFRVGTGSQEVTYNSGNGDQTTTITCDASHPCDLWLDESVSTQIATSGHVFKHYRINYAGGGGSTVPPTTSPPTTSSPTTSPPTTSSPTTSPPTTQGGSTSSTSSTSTSSTTSTSTSSTSTTSTTVASTTTTLNASGVSVSPSQVAPGGVVTLTSTGWQANATVTVVMNSDPVTLGTMTANAAGVATKQFTIPATAPTGSHTLALSGIRASGTTQTVTVSLTVASAAVATTTTRAPTSGVPMPRTGRDFAVLLMLGAGLVSAGTYLVRWAKRRGVRSSA